MMRHATAEGPDPGDALTMTSTMWTVTVLAAVSTLIRVLSAAGMRDHWTTVPVLGAYPWVVLGAGIAAVVSAVAWQRGMPRLSRPTATLALIAVIGAAMVLPRTVARDQPTVDGTEVTVGLINVRRGLASPNRIAQIVENTGIEVLVVIELTASMDRDLRRAGLTAALPHAIVSPTRSAAGGGVYTIGSIEPLRPPADGGDTPDIAITLPDGTSIEVTSTHPVPPIGPRRTQSWRDGLDRIGTPPEQQPALVVGDLNATLDHAALRDVLARGWRDAALEVGAGLTVTYDGLLDGSPGVPMALDHILVSQDIAVDSARSYDVDGTDHQLLVADLRLPAQ